MRKSTKKRSPSYRWLAGLLVIGAIIIILGLKIAESRTATSALSIAEGSASMASSSFGPAPKPSASVTEPARTTSSSTESDPLPRDPGAQVEWVIRNQKPAMILFHSTNCKPCKIMEDLVKKVRADYEARVVFVDVVTNDRSNLNLIRQAGIQAIPTAFFIRGDGQGKKYFCAMSEANLRTELDNLATGE